MSDAPAELSEVISHVRAFISPVAEAVVADQKHDRQWKPGGPWAA